jgi:TonB-linked SusC/RagA family outer membrane protein
MKKLLLFAACMLSVMSLFAQRTITGRVTDDKGNPLSNVSVTVKGTTTGTPTKVDGTYSVTVPAGARTLVFTSVDMAPQEVNITSSTTISVSMTTQAKSLDEVVVVAYGTQVKRKVTGSVAKVDAADLENKPFASVDQMLQGKVAGLQSVSPNGQPGGAQTVRIRGVGSVNAAADPLYVVDGVPVNIGDFSRAATTSNTLAGLNPNDIESVTVLKDAASSAVYGSRAANGVILITTKKGKAGKTKLRIDSEYGFGNVAYINEISKPLNRDEYFTLTREGLVNAGFNQTQIDATLNNLGINTTYNEDWFALSTRQGNTTNLNFSASGGDPKTTFYTSLGYFKQLSPIIGSEFSRYSGNLNFRHKAGQRLTIGANITASYSKQNSPSAGGAFRNPVLAAYFLRPTQNAYNADGTVNFSTTIFNQTYNPLAIIQYDRGLFNNIKTISTLTTEYDIMKNLKFVSKFGIDLFTIEEETYWNPFFGDARTAPQGLIQNLNTRVFNWVWTNSLQYHHDFLKSKNLGMDLQVGYEAQKSKQYNISASGRGVALTTTLPLPVPSTPQTASGARSDFSFVSVFSIANFSYKNKYSVSGSFRRDGSSRFGVNNKYGNFWSAGAAWNIDQERFLENVRFVNALKLRSSYGVNGNAGIGNYDWRATYGFAAASTYNQQSGSAPTAVGNPDLTWEFNKSYDIGLEVSVWQNRITAIIDYYNRRSSNLLFNNPLSRTSGFNSILGNIGTMENKGWEFTLNATPVRTKEFRWDINFNIALNRNKLIKLPNNNADILAAPFIRRVGLDVNSIYTRLWAGADPQTGNPRWFTDSTMKQTTSVLPGARGVIGSALPKGFGSFSTSVSYKGFSLDAQFNFQYGHLVWDQWGFITWSDGAFGTLNKIKKQLDRWQKPGDISNNSKYIYNSVNSANAESSRWYYKGDFIRLRDLTLSYQVPKKILDKIKMSNINFYVRGSNLWTKAFDKNITFDPEQGINGQNNLQVVIQRTISVGATLGF